MLGVTGIMGVAPAGSAARAGVANPHEPPIR
jgi:hypothetical protein